MIIIKKWESKIVSFIAAIILLLSFTYATNGIIANASSGWHYLSNHGNKDYSYHGNSSVGKLWYMGKEHYVLVKSDVPVYKISVKDGSYDPKIIGKKWLKKVAVVKGYYPPTSPSGFFLEEAKGFNTKKEAWIVHPSEGLFTNYWMKAVK